MQAIDAQSVITEPAPNMFTKREFLFMANGINTPQIMSIIVVMSILFPLKFEIGKKFYSYHYVI
jgi:hypothetical protein